MADNKKVLITSALPYVNGELHLGHLVGCWLPSDVYARFCRARGNDVLYICGADEHGTAAVVGAAKEGVPVIEYNNKFMKSICARCVILICHLTYMVARIPIYKKN